MHASQEHRYLGGVWCRTVTVAMKYKPTVLVANYLFYAFDLLSYLGDASEFQVRFVFRSMDTLALHLPSIAILALC